MFSRPGLISIFVFVLIGLSLFAGLLQVRTPEHGDQDAYLALASNLDKGRGFVGMRLSPFSPTTEIIHPEATRAPFYPLTLAMVAGDDTGFFLRAKVLTFAITMVLLAVVGYMVNLRQGVWASLIVVLLSAHNGPFAVHATELWCENLLLLFAFPGLILIQDQLCGNGEQHVLRNWAVIGFLLGLGYLTKVSVQIILISLVLTMALDARRKNAHGSWKGFILCCIVFVCVISPYLILNKINLGTWTRDVDLKGAFWLDSGRDFWRPYETQPGAISYFRTHTVAQVGKRFLSGLVPQAWNLVETSGFSFRGGGLFGVLVLFAASVGIARTPGRRWRDFQIIMVVLNLVLAAWYATIDVTPRFIYLLVPIIVVNACCGWVYVVGRLRNRGTDDGDTHPDAGRWAFVFLLPLLIADFGAVAQVKPPQPVLTPFEQLVVDEIRTRVSEDGVLCLGPTHGLPYSWLIDRKTVFLPDYASWDEVTKYMQDYKVDLFVLDEQLLFRRPSLFKDYVVYSTKNGILIRRPLPHLKQVWVSPTRSSFIMFVLE